MRNKKSFSFDEEKDAQEIFNNGFPDGNIDYSKMYLVAKFIRQTHDLGEIRLEREIIKFCKMQDKSFNPVTEADSIKKWVRSALRYNLRKIDSVSISQKEIDLIKLINNNKERKLLFSILVFSKALKKGSVKKDKSNLKASENYYIHYNNFLDIIRLSRLSNVSETDLADILYKYKTYFTFYNAERELIRLDFIDKTPHKEIIISDLNNLINLYSILFENKKSEYPKILGKCIICKKEFIKKSNRQRTCLEHSIILERRRKARWRNKHKKNKETFRTIDL
jgi:hypothetical protein